MVLSALWNSKSSMMAQQQKLDSISNNIANVSTSGYKREETSFQDLVYENIDKLGYPTSSNSKNAQIIGVGIKVGSATRDTSQGTLTESGSNTDLVIDGQGYFRVIRPDGGYAYERSGSFDIDSLGRLVDNSGNLVSIEYTNEGEAINTSGGLSKDNFSVNKNGEITVKKDSDIITYGKINIYNSVGDSSMASLGNSLYIPRTGATIYVENGSNVLQGYNENSNVDIAKEMTDMIIAQRSFELSSKGLKTADEMWGLINSMKR